MITVISGSNRRNSACRYVALAYADALRTLTSEEVKILLLDDIPHDWFHPLMYTEEYQTDSLTQIQSEYMIPAEKVVYISSEYNGSFPGVLKLFIDGCSVRQYKATFKGKKAALVGVATGRAGNLRGMDHLTGVLNHVGTIVMPNKLPISRVQDISEKSGEITDSAALKVLLQHAEEFLAF
jgi:chromate reductase, NAD(P)H dehydrogenase (quinone)